MSIDGFLRFADYFFDGLFADWAVLERIGESKSQVQKTKSQIEDVLNRLKELLRAAGQEQSSLRRQRDAIVPETEI
ncbi:MAG: hypothetical protein IJ390_10100 [Lachnospiraceae bacterium]|nr:hypothetical protein [Lachnospiraceae bacterium]